MTSRHGNRAPLVVQTTLAAAAAAFLAWNLAFRDREVWPTVGVVLGAVAAGVLLAMVLVRPEPRSATVPTDVRRSAADGWWAEPRSARSATPDRFPVRPQQPGQDTGRETVQLVLPVEGAGQPGQWWSQERSAPAGGSAPALPPAPDLSGYRDSARVVQCPRCGAFRIDVTQLTSHHGTGYVFRCRADDHEWIWQPGTAWPVTVVASRRRTRY